MADFLLEIGLEEIPARMIEGAEAELRQRMDALLTRESLISSENIAGPPNNGAERGTQVESYSTPRRLAVLGARSRREAGGRGRAGSWDRR